MRRPQRLVRVQPGWCAVVAPLVRTTRQGRRVLATVVSLAASRVCCGLLALAASNIGCASDAVTPTAPTASALAVDAFSLPPAAYDIYRAALGQLGPLGGGHPLVVREDTATLPWCSQTAGTAVGAEWREASDSYLAANRSVYKIASGQNIGAPYLVISQQRLDEFFGGRDLAGSWSRFFDAYPSRTLVTFSAVGFSADATRAVVQVGMACGSLCGVWRDFYFERRLGSWVATPLQTCAAIS